MRLAGLKLNDCVDGEGISVSLWTQGCPHRCKGCHNPETWDFNGGYEDETNNIRGQIIKALSANNTQRNFSVLGGEPLCEQNKEDVLTILTCVRMAYPHIKIFLWTGYIYEKLIEENDDTIKNILSKVDVLIDGPFIEKERDVSLYLRGSRNQRVIDLKQMREENIILTPILIDKN